jgi:putative membrane protein
MLEPKNRRLFISTLILIIVHLVGLIGINSNASEAFLLLTPVNLLLCFVLLLINHGAFNSSFYTFILITFLAGFFVEVAGVNTGMIFGKYEYGNTLGTKLFDVPLIIGINWFLLIYSAGTICEKLTYNKYIKSLIGAGLLVMLDVILEPVAVRYDFWSWDMNVIPSQNFIAWFFVSFLLLFLFYSLNFNKDNKLAKALYIIQFVFFALLLAF